MLFLITTQLAFPSLINLYWYFDDSPFILLVVWIMVQTLEGNFVSPNIMGKSFKIHPITIMAVLLVMGELLGVIGLILGIPIYAIIKVVGEYEIEIDDLD